MRPEVRWVDGGRKANFSKVTALFREGAGRE